MTEDDYDAPIEKSESAKRVRRIRASVMHLVDIKRAGHSPRYTELVVDSRDRIVAQPMSRPEPSNPLVQAARLLRRRTP